MKRFILMFVTLMLAIGVNAQMVTKAVTTHATATRYLEFSTDKSERPFGLQIIADSAKMGANDTLTFTFEVSNDKVNYHTMPSYNLSVIDTGTGAVTYGNLATTTIVRGTPKAIASNILKYKYLRVGVVPSTNDSVFTVTGYLFRN